MFSISHSSFAVTLPQGTYAGDTIHVKAPDGRINAIVVPDGMYAGDTFTVEFANAPPPSSAVASAEANKYSSYENPPVAPSAHAGADPEIAYAPATAVPSNQQDDFASGFGGTNNRY